MLGLLSGLGKGALEGKYEQRLLERKRFEEFQKQYMEQQLKAQELLPGEKEYISNVPRYQRAIDLAHEKLIPIPITRQTDGQRWKKSHNEVSKIVEV